MVMRGVRQQNASATTSSIRGQFKKDPKTRAEFMDLLRFRRDASV
jgi:GTP cyclohydrolase I